MAWSVACGALVLCPAVWAEDDGRYSGASDARAASVTEERFGPILDDTGALGPKLALGERVLGYRGDNVAIVAAGGDRSVFQSTVPMRAIDDDGRKREVSLELEDRGGFVAPENPLVEVRIGDVLGGGLRFDDIGVTIRPLDVDAGTRGDVDDNRVSYMNANEAADLDFVAAATPTGAETFDVLRSSDSPERLRYAVTLPDGAELVADPGGPGGLRVVRDGKTLLSIPPVMAADSDHKLVKASYELTDEGFAIRIAHRDADVRYPILVDPSLVLDQRFFDTNSGIYYKGWGYSQMGSWHALNAVYVGNGYRAMQIWNPLYYYIGPSFWGRFGFRVPDGAWISAGYLGHYGFLSFTNNVCATSGLTTGDHPGGGWLPAYNGAQPWHHSCSGFPSTEVGFLPPAGYRPKELAAQWTAYNGVWHTQVQWLYIGGAAVQVSDDTPPGKPSVSGSVPSGQWTATAPTKLTLNASDTGVGVNSFTATKTIDGATTTNSPASVCNASHTTNPYEPYLWCPASPTADVALGSVPEGVSSWTFKAKDLLGNEGPASDPHILKVDRSGPEIGLTGALWNARGTTLQQGEYDLRVAASDGSTSAPRSGATKIQLHIDGDVYRESSQSCGTAGNCSLSANWSLRPEDLEHGSHSMAVVAYDQVGNSSRHNFTVNVDHGEPLGPIIYDEELGNQDGDEGSPNPTEETYDPGQGNPSEVGDAPPTARSALQCETGDTLYEETIDYQETSTSVSRSVTDAIAGLLNLPDMPVMSLTSLVERPPLSGLLNSKLYVRLTGSRPTTALVLLEQTAGRWAVANWAACGEDIQEGG